MQHARFDVCFRSRFRKKLDSVPDFSSAASLAQRNARNGSCSPSVEEATHITPREAAAIRLKAASFFLGTCSGPRKVHPDQRDHLALGHVDRTLKSHCFAANGLGP